jgi:hypothetical protein
MLNIEYTIRDRYGKPKRYPANDAARLVCSLRGSKTITDWMRKSVLDAGGTATEVFQSRETAN